MNIVQRATSLLKSPKTEWPVIAAEPTTVGELYKGYIMLLAAIPAVCSFLKFSVIGMGGFGFSYRMGFGQAITTAAISYVLSLVMIYVMALIINALAPTFGGEKNPTQALKTAAYSYTAAWIAGVGYLVPGLYFLILLVGGLYSIYLLYLGLPFTMKSPQAKSAGYVALIVVVGIVLGWIIGMVTAGLAVMGGAATGGLGSIGAPSGDSVTFDKDSALGKLAAAGAQMEAASKKMEAAQLSGNTKASQEAFGQIMGAALGGAGGAAEALAPDRLKAFMPEQLAGMPRTRISSERNGVMGIQISNAKAAYASEDGKGVDLEITDSGGAAGLMGLAGWANMESDAETATGYERTRKENGRIIHEQWDSQSQRGEFSIVLGNRFVVKADGHAQNIEQLKGAVGSIDLAGLEALKNEGVKAQ
ncbi:MAG: Yip1 family protein [Steroidobacteraceae bacterium]